MRLKGKIKIYNAKLISQYGIIDRGWMLVENGKILDLGKGDLTGNFEHEISANGSYVSPGFIDMHVHGGGGYDFMDCSVEAFLNIAETHVKYGTTSLCPTTLTSEISDLLKTFDCYEEAKLLNHSGAQFLGIHLEGPYFNSNQRGAQDERFIRNPDPEEYEMIAAYSNDIIRWSAAPELPGAMKFGRFCKEKGILVALAHTDAVYDDVVEAFDNGYNLATHFYSAMSGVTRRNAYRHAGVIEACYLMDGIDVEIIADGIHLPEALLKLVYKLKGPKKTALITDAMRAAGTEVTKSILGSRHNGIAVIVEDGVAKMPDRKAFAGSIATADQLIRNMVKLAEVPLSDAVEMMTATPARILGLQASKGNLAPGYDADFIIFDDDINIQKSFVNGQMRFESKIKTNTTL